MRRFRDKYLPFVSKYNVFKLLNFILIRFFKFFNPLWLVRRAVRKAGIKYLNLGGYFPAANYLAIHLSSVELYGIPSAKYSSTSALFDKDKDMIIQTKRLLSSPGISLHYNLINGLPLDSDSISGINMSHFFEHFSREDGLKILNECYRVLKIGGVLRMSCPDLLVYAKAYVSRDSRFFNQSEISLACRNEGLRTFGDKFISKAYDNDYLFGHKWFYDTESAIDLLKIAGFTDIKEKKLHESSLPNIEDIEPAYRAPESFYIEAIK